MRNIAARLRTAFSGGSPLGHNYRIYGQSFGTLEYEDFVALARKFYNEAMQTEDSGYSVVKMPNGRTAVDFNGEVRGIYDKHGNPLAFFRPDFRSLGYRNREEELAHFRTSGSVAFG